jgi:predicted HD phosphohydrolase
VPVSDTVFSSDGMPARPATSLDDVLTVLRSGTAFDLALEPGPAHNLLDHSLQTAEVLRQRYPEDDELQVAGLVHDIGHLLPPYRDETHADVAAVFLRPVLGHRIAELVRLHVPAKRYLVTTEAQYGAQLDVGSVISLERQGGEMSAPEITAFESEPLAADAMVLRRADEEGKVQGLDVPGLDSWLPALQELGAG